VKYKLYVGAAGQLLLINGKSFFGIANKFRGVLFYLIFDFWCFNATFSNISAISWRPVLVVEEGGILGEYHRPWASNW
jgi:hypothetical protein